MYPLARAIAQCIVATFFGEVQVVGLERIPIEGPVIFVSNHNNKFVDASVIMACIPRKLQFLIATVSLKVRVVGRLAKFAGAIGVNRAQDMKYMGMGRIVSIVHKDRADGFYEIRGNDHTRFRIDCKKQDRIGVDNQQFVIECVKTDHLLLASRKTDEHPEPPPPPLERSPRQQPSTTEVPTAEVDAANLNGIPERADSTQADDEISPNARLSGTPPHTPISGTPDASKKIETSNCEASLLSSDTVAHPFTVYPKVDQGDVYESVSRALYEGSSICIFPEGGSHDQTRLLPLKPGVAVMALNSALLGVEDVLIVPVGIHYFDRDKFGSQAVVEIGSPLALNEQLVETYAHGSKKEAVAHLMTQVRERLEDCLIYAPSCEKLKVIKLCASLYPPDRMMMSVEKNHRLQALFTQLVNRYEVESKEIEQSVLEYGRLLEANGLQDSDVTSISQLNAELATFKLCCKLIPTLFLSLIVLPAVAMTFPLRWLASTMTERHRSEALAKSNVKVTAVDVIASYKIVWCICILPVIFVVFGIIFATKYPVLVQDRILGWLMSFVAAIVAQPLLTYCGLILRNQLPSHYKQMRCYYRVLISELDVWRGGEREVIIDRIEVQLQVRGFIKELAQKEVEVGSNRSRVKLREVFVELENLIPMVIIDTDTRRLLRQKYKLIPVVYRSAVMSREEIL